MKTTLILCSLFFLAPSIGEAQTKEFPFRSAAAPSAWKFFDGNSLQAIVANDGPYIDYRPTNTSGMYWPKGGTKTPVFTSGLWIVGKHHTSGAMRSSVQHYLSEFQAGPILTSFNTTTNDVSVAANPEDTTYRVYKISAGDNAGTNSDYADWPGHLGAPYNDVNANGSWDKGTDTPKLHGTQTLFQIYNDLTTTVRNSVGKSKPMGIEVQALVYGFDRSGPLQNTLFFKWKIHNKSDAQYDSLYFGLFSDTDMGDANDDVVGYDSALALSYVYNGDDNDFGISGYGTLPPACGFLFLSGTPSVSLFAHPLFLKHGTSFCAPPMGDTLFSQMAFNVVKALDPSTGNPLINPLTNQPSRFALSGDPVTNSGWTSAAHGLQPADIRHFLSIGPVTLPPGGVQEINAAFIIAQGTDRWQSITLLRNEADSIRKIVVADPHFATSVDGENGPVSPLSFAVDQNFPNPFNPSTTIRYALPRRSHVTLSVYTILGQHVTTLADGIQEGGVHSLLWQGTDAGGRKVASGMYFYHITAGSFSATKKMILLK